MTLRLRKQDAGAHSLVTEITCCNEVAIVAQDRSSANAFDRRSLERSVPSGRLYPGASLDPAPALNTTRSSGADTIDSIMGLQASGRDAFRRWIGVLPGSVAQAFSGSQPIGVPASLASSPSTEGTPPFSKRPKRRAVPGMHRPRGETLFRDAGGISLGSVCHRMNQEDQQKCRTQYVRVLSRS